MTNGDIMRLYDAAIARGGSANFVIIATVRAAIQQTRRECAEIVRNRQCVSREAIATTILQLPNSLNGIDYREAQP